MGLRKEAIFQNELGRFYKLNIYDSDFSGTPTDFTLSSRGFDLEYQCKDRTRFTGVIPSFVTLDIIPQNAADETLIDDIRNAPYKRFQMEILESVNVGSGYSNWWCGNILSDVSSEENLSFEAAPMTTITITDGLAQLEDVLVNENNTYTINQLTPFVGYIRQCLLNDVGTSFCWDTNDRFLYTMVNWYSSTMPSPDQQNDPLRLSGAIFRAFQEVVDNQNVSVSSFEMLERICRAFGARLFLSKGKWRFIQNNSYSQMSSGQWRREYLKGSNDVAGSDTDNLILSSGGNILGGGSFDILPPIQKVQIPYDFLHDFNLLIDDVIIWNTYTDVSGAHGPLTATVYNSSTNFNSIALGNINTQNNASLNWNLYAIPNYFGTTLQSDFSFPSNAALSDKMVTRVAARLKLVGDGGTTYYLYMTISPQGVGKAWTTSNFWIGNLSIFEETFPYGYWFGAAASQVGNGLTSITGFSQDATYNAIPDSGALSLEIFGKFMMLTYPFLTGVSPTYTEVDSSDQIYPNGTTQYGLANGIAKPDGTNEFLRYEVDNAAISEQLFSATQGTTVSTEILSQDTIKLGTGPNSMSNTRVISFTDTNLTTFDDGLALWETYEQSTGDGVTGTLTKILAKEILGGRKQGTSVFNGELRRDNFDYFRAYSNISGSKIFVPQQITFKAESSVWSGQWIECDVDISGQTYNSSDTPIFQGPNSNSNNY